MYIWLKYEGSGDIPDKYFKDEKAVAADKLQYLTQAEELIDCVLFHNRLEFDIEKTQIIQIEQFLEEHRDYHQNTIIRFLKNEYEKMVSHHKALMNGIHELEDIQKSKDKLLDWYCERNNIAYIRQVVEE